MVERLLAAILGVSIALAGCDSCEREDDQPRIGQRVHGGRGLPRDAGAD
ncbi:hypothetical protein LVJ94_23840 [Pendulispora rubella]|uniref:Uncharacterized protein n=1 Tax=Pendulispora rubella TaxID=2741070 RepID=A0ABZ2LHN2_9BACT